MQATALIVDDEATLIEYLGSKLARLWPDLTVVGTAQNGREALALCKAHHPDVVFLDIHMPGLNGLQVAEMLPVDTQIVFVTAFDQYAVEAFDRSAVDYLLKPVQDQRLAQTIARLKGSSQSKRSEILSLLRDLNPAGGTHLSWLRTGLEDTTELVSVEDVVYFKADQKYTSVVTPNREHYIRTSIKDLEQQLDPDRFWRIHRAIIVRVDQIVSARRDLRGRYALKLRERSEVLRSSQPYGHLFKHM